MPLSQMPQIWGVGFFVEVVLGVLFDMKMEGNPFLQAVSVLILIV